MTLADESRAAYRRIGGQLHTIQEIRDEAGHLIDTVTKPLKVEFRLRDVGQLLAGAFMMGIPVALAEEVWVLGETLPPGRILLIALLTILVLALFIWGLFYGGHIAEFKFDFFNGSQFPTSSPSASRSCSSRCSARLGSISRWRSEGPSSSHSPPPSRLRR